MKLGIDTLIIAGGTTSGCVSPALPTVTRDLSVAPEDIGLMFTVFALPGVFLMPLIGMAADRFNRNSPLSGDHCQFIGFKRPLSKFPRQPFFIKTRKRGEIG